MADFSNLAGFLGNAANASTNSGSTASTNSTAQQLAGAVKKYNDIPIDILPDDSFARLYAPGTKTMGRRTLDENTRQYDTSMQEEKRARQVSEALAQNKFDFDKEQALWERDYKNRAMAKSGGGGSSSKSATAADMLKAVRAGAIKYAQGLTQGEPFTVTRGLQKGEVHQGTGLTTEQAANQTVKMLNSQLGDMELSNANYNDIVSQVYRSLGLEPPTKSSSNAESEADLLQSILGNS